MGQKLSTPHKADTTTGFTLVELLIAVVIIVILSTIGIASFNAANSRNELQNQAKEMTAQLRNLRTNSAAATKPITGAGTVLDPSCKSPTATTTDQGTYYGAWMIIDKNTSPHSFYTGSACVDASNTALYGSSSPTNLVDGVSFGALPAGGDRNVILFTFDGKVFIDQDASADPDPSWVKDPTSSGTATEITDPANAIELTSGGRSYYIYFNGSGLVCTQEEDSSQDNCADTP